MLAATCAAALLCLPNVGCGSAAPGREQLVVDVRCQSEEGDAAGCPEQADDRPHLPLNDRRPMDSCYDPQPPTDEAHVRALIAQLTSSVLLTADYTVSQVADDRAGPPPPASSQTPLQLLPSEHSSSGATISQPAAVELPVAAVQNQVMEHRRTHRAAAAEAGGLFESMARAMQAASSPPTSVAPTHEMLRTERRRRLALVLQAEALVLVERGHLRGACVRACCSQMLRWSAPAER
eukprot:COSAG01_NODE_384_length_17775_cov_186.844648_5_plen_236_part_00